MRHLRKFQLALSCTILYFSVGCESSSVLDFLKKAGSAILPESRGRTGADFSPGEKFYNHAKQREYNQYTYDSDNGTPSVPAASFTEFVPLPPTQINGTDSSHWNGSETTGIGHKPGDYVETRRAFHEPSAKVKEERGVVTHTYKENYSYNDYPSSHGGGHSANLPHQDVVHHSSPHEGYKGGKSYYDTSSYGHGHGHNQPYYKGYSYNEKASGRSKPSGGHELQHSHSSGSHSVQARGHGWGWGGHGWGGGWGWGGGGHDSNLDLYSLLAGLSFAALLGAALLALARNTATTTVVNATGRRRRRDLFHDEDEPLLGGLSLSEFLSSLGISISNPWWKERDDIKPGAVVPFKLD